MKHKSILFFALSATVLFLASCSQGLFSKVEIKASPTIYAPLGNKAFFIEKIFSISEVTKSLNTGETAGVYQWDDPTLGQEGIMKFLIHYPIAEVPIDFSEYLEGLNFNTGFTTQVSDIKVTIPDLSITTIAPPVPLDINATLRASAQTSFIPVPITFLETGLSIDDAALPAIDLNFTGFDELSFSQGSIDITISAATGVSGPGFQLSITKISLLDGSNNEISATTEILNVVNGGQTSISLAGKTISKVAKITFEGSTQGGLLGNPIGFTITPSLNANSTISGATGISMDLPDIVPEIPFSISDSFFKHAKIGTGNIELSFAGIPDSLKPYIIATISLTQAGDNGLVIPEETKSLETGKFDIGLNGKNINTSNIDMLVEMKITNGTVTGLDGGSLNISMTSTSDISLLESVAINTASLPLSQNITEPVDENMLKWVKEIVFNQVGIRLLDDSVNNLLGLKNHLPSGNDVTIKATSAAFGINGSQVIPGGGDSGGMADANIATSNVTYVPKDWPTPVATDKSISFQIDIQLPPSVPPVANEATLKNIVPNTEIGFSGSIGLITDWTSATIDPSSADPISGVFPEATQDPIDFSSFFEYLPSGVNFAEVPVYLYVSGLPSLSMSAVIEGIVNKAGESESYPSILSNNSIGTVDPPNFVFDDNVFKNSLPAADKTSAKFFLTDIINARPDTLRIDYIIQPNNSNDVTINRTDVESSGNKVLKTEMVIILPLSIGITDIIQIESDLKPTETKTDLLGRKAGEVADKDDPLTIVMDSLVSLNMDISVNNTTGVGGTIYLTDWRSTLPNLATPDPDDTISFADWTGFKEQLSITSGESKSVLSLNKTKAQYIQNTIPFNPQMVITTGTAGQTTNLALNKTGKISMTITVSAATSINHTTDVPWGN